jgi:hypothetical protein
MDDGDIGRPLLGDGRTQHKKSDSVTSLGHTPGQRQHNPFRSAHAQRSEHIDNPHETHT